MAAQRLPGKPLLEIGGMPLIAHVWRRAQEAALGPVLVASDAQEVVRAVEAAGGVAVLTRAEHPTGSDRVFEAVEKVDPERRHATVINLQADTLNGDAESLRAALFPLADPAVDIATLAARLARTGDSSNPDIVKVIATPVSQDRLRALYFTRATAPWGQGDLLQHVGVYAFRREALARFAALPQSSLEQRERLEQLRALEAGMRIDVTLIEEAPLGIDSPADLQCARSQFPARTSEKANT
jgi:3-deoxy-manno-octulosonate cytidylyltransferase (CMP-KDO synthetase)